MRIATIAIHNTWPADVEESAVCGWSDRGLPPTGGEWVVLFGVRVLSRLSLGKVSTATRHGCVVVATCGKVLIGPFPPSSHRSTASSRMPSGVCVLSIDQLCALQLPFLSWRTLPNGNFRWRHPPSQRPPTPNAPYVERRTPRRLPRFPVFLAYFP